MYKRCFLFFICLAVLTLTFYGQQQESSETVKDIDGNVYNTVVIGTQVWMKENLKTTRYNDGTSIPNVTNDTQWVNLTTGAYSWYKNDSATYKNPYGALYNWYAVETGKLCPTGWHVASDEDWTTLIYYLGGYNITGGKLKDADTTYWRSPNKEATNESGFTAVAGGWRETNGRFGGLNFYAFWWTSTYEPGPSLIPLNKDNQAGPWMRVIFSDQNSIKKNNCFSKRMGFSVRCIKD